MYSIKYPLLLNSYHSTQVLYILINNELCKQRSCLWNHHIWDNILVLQLMLSAQSRLIMAYKKNYIPVRPGWGCIHQYHLKLSWELVFTNDVLPSHIPAATLLSNSFHGLINFTTSYFKWRQKTTKRVQDYISRLYRNTCEHYFFFLMNGLPKTVPSTF